MRIRGLPEVESYGWVIEQCTSSEQALSALQNQRFDAVISHEHITGMKGSDLLDRIKTEHPHIARLAIALAADPEGPTLAAQRSLRATSERAAINIIDLAERTTQLQRMVGSDRVRRVIGNLERLPAVPRTYWALVRAAGKTNCSLNEIAQIIESDPAMCLKVLQLVNSAFFGVAQRVTSISQAVKLLGLDLLKGLVLTAHVFATFETQHLGGFSVELFQAYSLSVAKLAKALLKGNDQADAAFTAGILHDIGKMVIAVRFPREFALISQRVAETDIPLPLVEIEVLGVTHAEVGAALLATWGLPGAIVEAVAYHHNPRSIWTSAAGDYSIIGAVHAADVLHGVCAFNEPEDRLDVSFLQDAGFGPRLEEWRRTAQSLATPR